MADVLDRISEVSRSRRILRAIGLGVVLVSITIIAYLPALNAGWIWDDDSYVTENTLLRDLDGLGRIWVPKVTPQYYPIVFTTFWIEYQLWELNPRGYHLVNILLHGLNAVLLWIVMQRLRVPGAWLIAAVFAVHPVMVESVAWVTERKNVLSLFFYLASALCYLRFDALQFGTPTDARGSQSERSCGRESWGWYGAAIVLFLFALLSKSVTCSLPAALILALLWLREPLSVRRLLPLAPMFVIGFVLAMNTAMIERAHVGAVGPDFDFSFIERCLIASRALLFYPGKLLWPEPLMFIYERWKIDAASPVQYLPLFICIAVAVVLVALYRKGMRGPFLSLAFYAGTVFPALGFFNVYPHIYSFVADHFQYHASIGVIALVVSGAVRWGRPRWLLRAAGVLVLALLLGLTYRQTIVYNSAETVWRDTIARNERAWMPRNNLASLLLGEAGRWMAAGDADRAAALAREAAEHARVSIEIRPQNHIAYANLSEAQRLLGQYEAALESLDQAITQAPHMLDYLWQKGRILELLDRTEEAMQTFRAAVERAPKAIRFRHDLARLLVREGAIEEAEEHFVAILELRPTHFAGLGTLAGIRETQGRYASADRLYRRAVDAAPTLGDQIEVVTRLIRFLSQCPDPRYRDLDEALDLATHLVERFNGRDPASLIVLAAVHAQRGELDAADALADQAIALARAQGMDDLVAQIQRERAVWRGGEMVAPR